IMLATFMVAIEATIVATAMPRIVGQLGGFSYYSCVFSAFLLAQSTTTVIYGKLSDIFGCSADAGNIGRLARCGEMRRLRSDVAILRLQGR
ncbi:hypothetical protein ACC697_38500, partial [Rhizobium ruizarguesonis]